MNDIENTDKQFDELTLLKQRADQLGIKYSGNIGKETLKERIEEALLYVNENDELPPQKSEPDKPLTPRQIKARARQERIKKASKLVRIRLTVYDPKAKGRRGEIFSAGNDFIGTYSKFIPYDSEFYEDGYHVPHIIYQELLAKQYLHISTKRDRETGRERITSKWTRMFGIEVLPQLTKEELTKLAQRQKATGSIED